MLDDLLEWFRCLCQNSRSTKEQNFCCPLGAQSPERTERRLQCLSPSSELIAVSASSKKVFNVVICQRLISIRALFSPLIACLSRLSTWSIHLPPRDGIQIADCSTMIVFMLICVVGQCFIVSGEAFFLMKMNSRRSRLHAKLINWRESLELQARVA